METVRQPEANINRYKATASELAQNKAKYNNTKQNQANSNNMKTMRQHKANINRYKATESEVQQHKAKSSKLDQHENYETTQSKHESLHSNRKRTNT